ncbi:MAG: heavy-metal-associated domain-containing protein [Chlorobiota bacterium]|jgi:copper chaperone CopZ|nr:MAG: heavy-metal-associated domain-containing protein [Chlorobiota bacterium]
MKYFKLIIFVSTIIIFVNAFNKSVSNNLLNNFDKVEIIKTDTIKVPDMQCEECEERLKSKLLKLKGVSKVEANAIDKIVVVDFDSEIVKLIDIKRLIAKIGYNAEEVKTTTSRRKNLPQCCQPGGHK